MWKYLTIVDIPCPLQHHWSTIGQPEEDIKKCLATSGRVCPNPGEWFHKCQHYPGGFECWTPYIEYMRSKE